MKCISCETEIPPSWKAAIVNNLCPACGGAICNEAMKELMDALADALERMPNDAQGVAGWLLSNYQLTKIGTGEPVNEFYGVKPKLKEISIEDELRNNPKIRENPLDTFYKRSGLKTPKDYKALKEKIDQFTEDEEISDDVILDTDDFVEEALDPDFTQKVLSTMEQKVYKKDLQRLKNNQDINFGKEEKIHPALQHERMERLKKQQEVSFGGKVGIIRRDV